MIFRLYRETNFYFSSARYLAVYNFEAFIINVQCSKIKENWQQHLIYLIYLFLKINDSIHNHEISRILFKRNLIWHLFTLEMK